MGDDDGLTMFYVVIFSILGVLLIVGVLATRARRRSQDRMVMSEHTKTKQQQRQRQAKRKQSRDARRQRH